MLGHSHINLIITGPASCGVATKWRIETFLSAFEMPRTWLIKQKQFKRPINRKCIHNEWSDLHHNCIPTSRCCQIPHVRRSSEALCLDAENFQKRETVTLIISPTSITFPCHWVSLKRITSTLCRLLLRCIGDQRISYDFIVMTVHVNLLDLACGCSESNSLLRTTDFSFPNMINMIINLHYSFVLCRPNAV